MSVSETVIVVDTHLTPGSDELGDILSPPLRTIRCCLTVVEQTTGLLLVRVDVTEVNKQVFVRLLHYLGISSKTPAPAVTALAWFKTSCLSSAAAARIKILAHDTEVKTLLIYL